MRKIKTSPAAFRNSFTVKTQADANGFFDQNPATGALIPKGSPVNSSTKQVLHDRR